MVVKTQTCLEWLQLSKTTPPSTMNTNISRIGDEWLKKNVKLHSKVVILHQCYVMSNLLCVCTWVYAIRHSPSPLIAFVVTTLRSMAGYLYLCGVEMGSQCTVLARCCIAWRHSCVDARCACDAKTYLDSILVSFSLRSCIWSQISDIELNIFASH